MNVGERLAFAIAVILFVVFLSNVILGAAGAGVILGDVAEMITLFGSCISFVTAVLMLERRRRESGQ